MTEYIDINFDFRTDTTEAKEVLRNIQRLRYLAGTVKSWGQFCRQSNLEN